MAGTRYHDSLDGSPPILVKFILAASTTFTVGDLVKPSTSSAVTLATTGARIVGWIHAIVTNAGMVPQDNGTSGTQFIDTYATASDNLTVGKICALVDVSKFSRYSMSANATLGTTTGSDQALYYVDVADEDDIAENTATQTFSANLITWGLDPKDTTRAIVSIVESSIFGV